MKKINHLDLFSGIGGFHLGFERAGFKINSFFSEIDKHAIAVYKHKFPKSTYVGSVTNVRGGDLPRIDLITFGSPCQDFSLAGKRKGMEGERSSLILEAIRLIGECRPRVFIWENVKGAFSSNNGEDFAAILQAFANIGGYRLEWQLLNTAWFLPQNRERIYLVGYSTEPKRGWRGVFPITTNERETLELQGQCVPANTILQRYTATANGTYIGERELTPQVKQIGTKLDSNGGTQPYQQDRVYDADGIVPALNRGKSDLIIKANYGSKSLNETIERNTLNEGEPKALDLYNREARDESPTLTEPHHNSLRLFDGYRIRRLTPIECERLQGFPDDHTALGNYDGETKPMSNTQRYKQCGNAVTVDVVEAVAKKCIPLF
jgi:DNA (cytosine-5)-methyltransferase 1